MTDVRSGPGVRWWTTQPTYEPDGPEPREPRDFHRILPGYAVTPLVRAPTLAAAIGVGELLVKDESDRLELPSFKMLGASWATWCALRERVGPRGAQIESMAELREAVAALKPLTLVAATDGNHGRGVARMASLLGLDARIFVPRDMTSARIDALITEGADVIRVEGTYDDAVDRAKAEAGSATLIVSDTAWPGYEDIPRRVIDGYATLFLEIDEQISATGHREPDVVVVQMGVGALAAAVIRHYRRRDGVRIVGVEPSRAACVAESFLAGHPSTIEGAQDSIMAGLNCGTPSPLAWPELSSGLDAYVVIDDVWARRAMRAMADAGITSGESGAAGVAGLLALHAHASTAELAALQLDAERCALALSTEGATDPESWRRIVGREPMDAPTA